MEQIVYNVLVLLIVAFGFYCLGYGVGVFKEHPAKVLGLMLRSALKGVFWLVRIAVEGTYELGRALLQGAPAGAGGAGLQGEPPFLEGRAKRKLISRWHRGLTVDGRRRITRDNSFRHLLLVSPTGGGKTSGYCIPAILQATGASLIVTDPGGSLFRLTSGWMASRGYSIRVLNLTDSSRGERYNPLALAETHTQIDQVSHLLVETAFPNAGGEQSFWSQGAQEIISILLKCLKKEPETYHNLANVRYLLNRFETYGRPLYRFIDRNADEQVFHQFRSFISQDLKVLQGMLSTAKAALGKFSDPELCLATSESTFRFDELRSTPTVVYLIVREDQVSYFSFILTLFYSQLFSMCMQLPEDDTSALPIYCILEEAGNMGKLPDFSTVITTLRRRRTSCSLILQDLGQLEDLYGRSGAQVIVNSCSSRIFLPGLPHETCTRIAQMIGRREDENGRMRQVMSASEIRTLPDGKAIFVFGNKKPALLDVKPFYRNRKLRKRTQMPPAPIPELPEREVVYLDLAPASGETQRIQPPTLGGKPHRQDEAHSQSAGTARRAQEESAQRDAKTHPPAASAGADDEGVERASTVGTTTSGTSHESPSSPSPPPSADEEEGAESEVHETSGQQSVPDDNRVQGVAQSADSVPPWAGALLQESRRARQEVEVLRETIGVHVVTRKEAAKILGVSTRTLQRWEKQGLLERANVSAPGVHYDYEHVLELKRKKS